MGLIRLGVSLWRDATRPDPSSTRTLARLTLCFATISIGALLALVAMTTCELP